MLKNRVSILAVAVTVVFAMAAVGQEQRKPQSFTERYGQQLGLTDVQKKNIDELEAKFDKDHAEFLDSYHKTMSEYREARQANDTAKLDALKPKMDSQRAEMMKLRAAQEDKIAENFTDAQKAQWSKIKEERAARMKEREQRQ
jgi:Spy/CpxP family protein refolding chaperone